MRTHQKLALVVGAFAGFACVTIPRVDVTQIQFRNAASLHEEACEKWHNNISEFNGTFRPFRFKLGSIGQTNSLTFFAKAADAVQLRPADGQGLLRLRVTWFEDSGMESIMYVRDTCVLVPWSNIATITSRKHAVTIFPGIMALVAGGAFSLVGASPMWEGGTWRARAVQASFLTVGVAALTTGVILLALPDRTENIWRFP